MLCFSSSPGFVVGGPSCSDFASTVDVQMLKRKHSAMKDLGLGRLGSGDQAMELWLS